MFFFVFVVFVVRPFSRPTTAFIRTEAVFADFDLIGVLVRGYSKCVKALLLVRGICPRFLRRGTAVGLSAWHNSKIQALRELARFSCARAVSITKLYTIFW